jgi:glutamate racemase
LELSSEPKTITIGLFDSGVGGLSVLRKIIGLEQSNPDTTFQFVYLADTARCPYGNREPEELRSFIGQIVGFLSGHDVDHVIMACNTSAAVGLDTARNLSPVPVHDLISAACRHLAAGNHKIGVMATAATAKSHVFLNRLSYFCPSVEVVELGCPNLVPLVESGDIYSDKAKSVLIEYTNYLEEEGVDTILLGCTHFPFLRTALADLLPPEITIIDPADLLVRQLADDLDLQVGSARAEDAAARVKFHVTGNPSTFIQTAEVCLGADGNLARVGNVLSLSLEKLVASEDYQRPGANPVSNVIPLTQSKSASQQSQHGNRIR